MKFRALYLLVMLATLTSGLWAQDLSKLYVVGSAKHEPGELIDRAVKDVNQMVCAGLIIYSDLEGLTYQANNEIVKMNRLPGKDFLFIQSEERVITVYKTGYAPLKIVLNEYGIKLAEGKVYSITVTGDKPKIVGVIPVNFQITPSDATVYINGENKGTVKTVSLDPGTYDLKIEKSGYETHSQKITVNEQSSLFYVALKEVDLQKVTIKSTPSEAEIFINQALMGATNKQLFLYPGEYTIEVKKSGYIDRSEKITIATTGTNEFSYNLQKNEATITVNAIPSDAKITVNGSVVASGKATPISPGKVVVVVSRSGYFVEEKTFELKLGEVKQETIQLKKNTGTLTISSSPMDAQLLINKQSYSQGTVELPPGRYKVEISKEGYYTFEKTVEVAVNSTEKIDASLTPQVGKLQFTIAPIEAKITLTKGGKVIHTWEGANLFKDLMIGTYELTAKAPGYKTFTKNVTITENQTTVEDVQMKQGSDAPPEGFVFVEGGTFKREENNVTLSDFYIGKYEVTQKEWVAVMENNPSYFKGDNLPVENVSWNAIQTFIKKLNEKTGMNYRLPTEAEWEFAARGGNKSKGYTYSGSSSIDEVAWYDGNSGSKTHPIGTKKPNELGIYDMSGNVWEWVQDWYFLYPTTAQVNPTGPKGGSTRVLRGGSWYYREIICDVANRLNLPPGFGTSSYGFRLVQDK